MSIHTVVLVWHCVLKRCGSRKLWWPSLSTPCASLRMNKCSIVSWMCYILMLSWLYTSGFLRNGPIMKCNHLSINFNLRVNMFVSTSLKPLLYMCWCYLRYCWIIMIIGTHSMTFTLSIIYTCHSESTHVWMSATIPNVYQISQTFISF